MFKKCCGSTIHDNENDASYKMDMFTKKKINSTDYNLLLERGIINERTHYTCEQFLVLVKSTVKSDIHNVANLNELPNDDNGSNNSLEENVMQFFDIGNALGAIIKPDILELYHDNAKMKKISSLVNYNPLQWLSSRPPELVHLISNMCKIDLNTASQNKLVVVAKIVELI